jgi:hypothetical protein
MNTSGASYRFNELFRDSKNCTRELRDGECFRGGAGAERRTYDHRAARFVVEPNPAAPGNRGGGRGLSRPDGPDRSGVSIRWHAFTGDRHAARKERSGDANPDSPPHNAGAKEAASEYIAFTDAGIRLDPYWLESLCAAFNPAPGAIAPRPDIVFGSYEPILSKFFHRCAATA